MRLAIATVLASLAVMAWGLERPDPGTPVPEDQPGWISFDEALQRGEASGRPSMIFLYADWCGWCRKTFRETFTNDQVLEYLGENFQSVKLNVEAETPVMMVEGEVLTERDLSAVLGAEALPTYVFLSADGRPLARTEGFYLSEPLLDLLEQIASGAAK